VPGLRVARLDAATTPAIDELLELAQRADESAAASVRAALRRCVAEYRPATH
jgi:hypothetical protein